MGLFEWLTALILFVFAVANFDFSATPTTDTGRKITEIWQDLRGGCLEGFWEKAPDQRRIDCFGR